MKYTYATVTGNQEIEVDEGFGEVLLAMDMEEANSNRKHSRRRPVSLDSADYDGEWFADDVDLLGDVVRKESHESLQAALMQLTHEQRSLIKQVYLDGVHPSTIAIREGVTKSAISHRLALACKRLVKIIR